MLIRSRAASAEPALDMTPMIDTVFNLLIFFLVAGSFQQAEHEMRIALPAAASAGPISAALREITINVDRDGSIIVTGKKMQPDELRKIVHDAVTRNAEQKVTVRGDRQTAYANIVSVLDVCKSAGVQEPYLDTVLHD
jgi:biopolymer transport protein ExbD